MCNDKRRWCVAVVETPEQLTEKLTGHSWCCCAGFRLGKYVFLNDAFSEDGAAEFGVLVPDGENYRQIESWTVSWMTPEQFATYLAELLTGKFDDEAYATVSGKQIEAVGEHRDCRLCA